jgi:methyl-accepting chemotaxis protein
MIRENILFSLFRMLITTFVVAMVCIGFAWACMDLSASNSSAVTPSFLFVAMAATAFITGYAVWLWPRTCGVVMSNGGRQQALMPVEVGAEELKNTSPYVAIMKEQLLSAQKDSEEGVLSVINVLNEMYEVSVNQVALVASSKQKENELETAFKEKMQIDTQLGFILQMFVDKQEQDVKENLARVRRLQDIKDVSMLVNAITGSMGKIDALAKRMATLAQSEPDKFYSFSSISTEISQFTKRALTGISEISGKIELATKGVDEEVKSAMKSNQRNAVSGNMRRVVEDVESMQKRFLKATEQTLLVINGVREGHQLQLNFITTALGLFQFQDINRQRVEQVVTAMTDLDQHLQEISDHLVNKSWTPNAMDGITDKLEQQKNKYVMSKQFSSHARIADFDASDQADQSTARPAIELF